MKIQTVDIRIPEIKQVNLQLINLPWADCANSCDKIKVTESQKEVMEVFPFCEDNSHVGQFFVMTQCN